MLLQKASHMPSFGGFGLKELVGEMSRPVMPHEEAREYIATQIVSEYLANRVEPRLHGIIFNSAQTGGGGHNIVLFNGARSVETHEPRPGTSFRVRIPPQPGIPPPGTESREDLLIQTDPQRADGENQRSVEDPPNSAPETQDSHGDSILRLDRQSLKVLRVSGVKYDSEPLNLDHYVSLDPVSVRFGSPTAKVTVFRRHQHQETGQVPVEVEPDIQTSS